MDDRPARPAGRHLAPAALLLLAIAALAPRLFVAWCVPLLPAEGITSCAPDELQHVEVALWLSRGDVPGVADTGTAYPAYLPTNYAVQAMAWAAGRAVGGDLSGLSRVPSRNLAVRGFPLARLGSALLGVAFVLLVADAVSLLARPALGLFAGLLAAFHPQLVFVTGYVNGDAFTIAAGGFLANALVRWWRAGEGDAGLAPLGAAAGLVLLGKPNGYGLLLPTAAWVLWAAFTRRASWRAVAAAGGAAGLVAAPFLSWNAVRNHGDVLGSGALRAFIAAHPWLKPARAVPGAMTLFPGLFGRSSFALFGNMTVEIATGWHRAAALLLSAGAAAGAFRLRSAKAATWRLVAWVLLAAAAQLALLLYMCWSVDFQPQGRYAMPGTIFLGVACLTTPLLGPPEERPAPRRLWAAACLALLALAASASARALMRAPCG